MIKGVKSTDFGINVYGYNADVDGAETIWSHTGAYPWANAAANAAVTIESASAADKGTATAGTGLRTVEIEGLQSQTIGGVTGTRIIQETVILNGATPVALANEYTMVYRIRGLTSGTGLVNAGAITIKKGATTVGVMLAGINVTEFAVMQVPQFTIDGLPIRGAWVLGWHAAMFKKTTETADIILKVSHSGLFAVRARHTIAQDISFSQQFIQPFFVEVGTQIELAAAGVGAADQRVAGGFALKYEV